MFVLLINQEDNKGVGSHAEDSLEARRFILALFRITGMLGDYKRMQNGEKKESN